MDEELIETIRETSRHLLLLNRRRHRDEVADVRRSMVGLSTNSDIVANIARKLKTKSSVTVSQLHTLKNALMDDAANIELVLHTEGAVRGLVREMTGIDVNKQGAALGCFCNLALGEAKACLIISKAAGPYLVPMLDNMNAELAITSAWTLGNLAGSGKMVCDLLTAQGAIDKLVDLLLKNNEETRESILYALVHFVHQLQDSFPHEHVHKMMFILPSLRMAESIQLFYFLSFHINFNNDFVTSDFVLKGLRYLNSIIQSSHDPQSVAILFRFTANLNSTDVFRMFLNYFGNYKLDLLKKLYETENVKDSVLWFLGNAYKCCGSHDAFEELLK